MTKAKPITVWLVTSGCYSDYGVNAVCSSEAKANEFKALFPRDDYNDLEEVELDFGIDKAKAGWRMYDVWMSLSGDAEKCEPSGYQDPIPSSRTSRAWIHKNGRFVTAVAAKSPAGAIKISNERRAIMIEAGMKPGDYRDF